jgi:glutamyl-tRNA reductase
VTVALIGLNFRTAPVELREKLARSGPVVQSGFAALQAARGESLAPIDEVVILQTCNRLEIYYSTSTLDSARAATANKLAELEIETAENLAPHLYELSGETAVNHLMRVACGLDSMILGETQILGQITRAFEDARIIGLTGAVLSHLFSQAAHCGKRAHSETNISKHSTSVSHAGVRALLKTMADVSRPRILVVGAGEMAALAAQAIQHLGNAELAFVNRTLQHAEALARELNGGVLAWHQLREGLVWADAIVSATSALHTVIHRTDIEAVLPYRSGRRLSIMDLAVPRDVEGTVRNLPTVHYLDIDDLQTIIDANLERRRGEVPRVEAIIREEMARFREWYHGRQVTPVIRTLREWAQSIAADEVGHTLSRLSDADDHTRETVSRLAHHLVNRLLHEPTSRLRLQAGEGNGIRYAHAIRELFALSEMDAAEYSPDDTCCARYGATAPAVKSCTGNCILSATMDHRS